MSFVLPLPREMHLWISSSNVPRLPSFLEMLQNPHVLLTFDKVHNRLRLPRETSSERPKVVRRWCALHILTSKCVLRHDSLHFFDIATSKKSSEPGVFCTFWLRHVLRATAACTFSNLNFQKWSGPGVFCTFWLQNVLRATTACNFSSLIWPDGSAPAALATFRPSGATNHWKNKVFRDFSYIFAHLICSFFLLTLSLLWSSLFYSSLLSDSSHLCFSSVHIVGSLTSKLPSVISICAWYLQHLGISRAQSTCNMLAFIQARHAQGASQKVSANRCLEATCSQRCCCWRHCCGCFCVAFLVLLPTEEARIRESG